jgi:hypothetical protein
MKAPRSIAAAAVVLGLVAMATPAQAAGVVADISITSVRLTDKLVFRIEASYVCPAGFAVPPSWLPRATVSQEGVGGGSSQHKKFDDILCDGSRRTVLVRFVKPRYGDQWQFDALTQVTLNFRATMDAAPYSSVFPQDTEMVVTRASARAEVVADLTVQRVLLSDRGVLRAKAAYTCPAGFAVQPGLPPFASARQDTDGTPQSVKSFGGITCDGTRRSLVVRFAHPRSPDGAQWQPGALTHINLYFQASMDNPYFYVLAMDAQSSIV